jgi:hypothetical protein
MDELKQKNISERHGKIVKNSILIQRRSPNSDIWICNSCTWTGDLVSLLPFLDLLIQMAH